MLQLAPAGRGGGDSFAFLETLIEREQIACTYRRTGRFIGAHSRGQYEKLVRKGELLSRSTGADFEMVPKARQHEEIATDFYCGGMVVNRTGALQPALYHAGLLASVRRAGVRLCPNTEMRAIEPTQNGFMVQTSAGPLRARQVIIATNGYTGRATPFLQRRVIPVASFIIATEPIPGALATTLIPKGRTISDTKRVLYYFRMSPDGRRVIFGGRAGFRTTR